MHHRERLCIPVYETIEDFPRQRQLLDASEGLDVDKARRRQPEDLYTRQCGNKLRCLQGVLTLLTCTAITSMTHVPGPVRMRTSANGCLESNGANVTWYMQTISDHAEDNGVVRRD